MGWPGAGRHSEGSGQVERRALGAAAPAAGAGELVLTAADRSEIGRAAGGPGVVGLTSSVILASHMGTWEGAAVYEP